VQVHHDEGVANRIDPESCADAPESEQLCRGSDSNLYRCGSAAAIALADRIAGSVVTCSPRATIVIGASWRYARPAVLIWRGGL
jgi:endonuclease YncB( thermonuclease family)